MNTINNIGFPGLGIGPFKISDVAFSILGVKVAWYGIFVTVGILLGILYAFWRGQKNNGIPVDDMIDVALFSIPAAIIGAKVYYVIFAWNSYESFGDIFTDFGRGLAVYGGIIFGCVAGFLVCKFKKISFLKVFDSSAPAIMLGQIIGRWGNFTNMEAYGVPTNLPWRMSVENYKTAYAEVHPIFLYECLWNILGFVIINFIYKKKKFDGQIFLMYITWYGFGRMFIEGIRGEDTLMLGGFRISQVVGFLCVVIGIALIVLLASKYKTRKLENEEYAGVYMAAKEKLPDEAIEENVEEIVKETDEADEKDKPDEVQDEVNEIEEKKDEKNS